MRKLKGSNWYLVTKRITGRFKPRSADYIAPVTLPGKLS